MAISVDRWDDVRIFLAVARAESLSAAAHLLGTDQSTVSRRLAALEAALGVVLVERQPQGARLTPLGARVLSEAQALELQMHRFLGAVSAEDPRVVGCVRIAATEGLAIHFLIPRVLPALRVVHPALRVELVTGTQPVDLARHEADVALRFFRDERGELTVRRLGSIERTVMVRADRLRALRKLTVAELPWIAGSLDAFEGLWLKSLGVRELTVAAESYEAQLAAIRAGLGVGVQARPFLQLYPELRALDSAASPPPLELFLVTRSAVRKTARIAAVCRVLIESFAAFASEPVREGASKRAPRGRLDRNSGTARSES